MSFNPSAVPENAHIWLCPAGCHGSVHLTNLYRASLPVHSDCNIFFAIVAATIDSALFTLNPK